MKTLRRPLAKAFSIASRVHHALYDRGMVSAVRLPVPVISIGNLTIGGTGKTPVTSFCLHLLKAKGHKPGLVVRSYGVRRSSPARVNLRIQNPPQEYGDEAAWYATQHPDVPIWSGPKKWITGQALCEAESVDIVLVDDGYQHRKLHRDLDLLLLDSTDSQDSYEVFPLGRARESFFGAKRADAILWTKANLRQSPSICIPEDRPQFHFESHLDVSSLEEPVILLSGIARPESFQALVLERKKDLQFKRIDFRDHHSYTERDVQEILRQAQAFRAKAVITTEKDFVKLQHLWPQSNLPLRALPLEVHLQESVELFYELLKSAMAHRAR